MLIEKNLRNKRKSWYICDRCGEKLTGISRHLVTIDNIKQADVCRACKREIKKFIQKKGVYNGNDGERNLERYQKL